MLSLLSLLGLAFALAVPAALVLALRTHMRMRALEERLAALEGRRAPARLDGATPESEMRLAPDVPTPDSAAHVVVTHESSTQDTPTQDDALTQDNGPRDMREPWGTPVAPSPIASPSRATLVEAFGARWAVWLGGLALALGGVLLVRYSIEQGYFGPLARCLGGLVFGALLISAGETLRRRERAASTPIPSVLTAAGIVAAFAAIYAAHGLYDLIGSASAFIALGAVALAAMAGAALHGPALAGLGLIGALATPVLVASSTPNPWPVALYIAVVAGAAFALSRVRRWLWLAVAGAVGAALWAALLAAQGGANFLHAGLVLALAGAGLAGALVGFLPHVTTEDDQVAPDWIGAGLIAAFALAAAFAALVGAIDASAAILLALIVGALAAIAGLVPAVAALAPGAGLLALAVLVGWTGAGPRLYELAPLLRAPDAPELFAGFAAAASALVAAFSVWRIHTGRLLPALPVGLYALAATATPLAALSLCYLRLARADISLPYAALAGALAACFAWLAGQARRDVDAVTPLARKLPLGAFATAALGGLALGCVFALDRGMLTVALALTGLAAAWLSVRFDIGALRWSAAAMALIVLARLIYEPRIFGGDLGTTPIFNWLLFGYGVPALAFGYGARMMRRAGGEDRPVMILESLTLALAAALVFFEMRHAFNGGDIYARLSGLAELGALVTCALGFAITLTWMEARRASPVLRNGSYIFAAIAAWMSVGLLRPVNPLFDCAPVGGLVINILLIGFAAPALGAGLLRHVSDGRRPAWFGHAAGAGAVLFSFLYVVTQTRRMFVDADGRICAAHDLTSVEIWTHSAVWLAIGLALLLAGLLRHARGIRFASAIYVLAAILKIFLYDLSGLEGLPRALSFIVLGFVLIGIGLLYQRLLFRASPQTPAPPGEGVV